MDKKSLSLDLSVKAAWWLRPVAYPTYIIMKFSRCDQDKIDNAMDRIFRKAIKYKVGNRRRKRAYGTQ